MYILQFSSNRITHLDNNSFCQSVNIEINISNSKISIPDQCKVTNIYSIDLTDNNLTTVAQHSFRPIKNLENLYLEKNRLKEIKDGTFEGNTKLTRVQLSRNNIRHFTKDSFPETLKRLDLDGNRLVHLKSNMFCKMKVLGFLQLQENYITFIDEDTFKFNTQLRTIYLQRNKITTLRKIHLNIIHYYKPLIFKEMKFQLVPG